MALAGALCVLLNSVVGFTNRSLRAQVAGPAAAPPAGRRPSAGTPPLRQALRVIDTSVDDDIARARLQVAA